MRNSYVGQLINITIILLLCAGLSPAQASAKGGINPAYEGYDFGDRNRVIVFGTLTILATGIV